ncbi:hypothetical protein CsSME_00020287 [Camellia sinensis var. sinensis]
MNGLLGYNDIVTHGSSRNKVTLVEANNFIQEWFDSPNKDFGNDFIRHITEAYGAELFVSLRVLNFGNKSNKSSIDLMGYGAGSKAVFDKLTHSGTNSLPIGMIENSLETIWARGFEGLNFSPSSSSIFVWWLSKLGSSFFFPTEGGYGRDNMGGVSYLVYKTRTIIHA